MINFEIIGIPGESYIDWILDASAQRGSSEVRVATPSGPKLAKIEDFELTEETPPDVIEYSFRGRLWPLCSLGRSVSSRAPRLIDC
jgi:hypothetical protein